MRRGQISTLERLVDNGESITAESRTNVRGETRSDLDCGDFGATLEKCLCRLTRAWPDFHHPRARREVFEERVEQPVREDRSHALIAIGIPVERQSPGM